MFTGWVSLPSGQEFFGLLKYVRTHTMERYSSFIGGILLIITFHFKGILPFFLLVMGKTRLHAVFEGPKEKNKY